MKKYIDGLLAFVAFLVFIAVVMLLTSCDRALRKEIESLREELAKQQQYVPLQRDTIRDSVEVITQKVREVEKIKEVLSKEDKQLIKDLGMKVKELEALQKTGIETRDTVYLTAALPQPTEQDSVPTEQDSVPTEQDSLLVYRDAWTEIEYDQRQRKMAYKVKDSLDIALKREYKHRFLWWKWGVKGYDVKVMNFNPHATIKYNSVVKRKE